MCLMRYISEQITTYILIVQVQWVLWAPLAAFVTKCMQWPCRTLSVRLQNCAQQHFCLRLGKKMILFPKIDVR